MNLLHDAPKHAKAVDALIAVLRERGLTDAKIGIEMDGLPTTTKDVIVSALPRASIKDCTNLIRLVRAVKSAEEVNRLTRSAEINEQAGIESLSLAASGRPTVDLAQWFRSRVAELGADFDHFAFSIAGLGICTEPNHLLTSNDVLFVDFGCVYSSYFSDTGTTLAIQDVSPVLSEKHEALRLSIEAGAKVMRPGVKSSEIQNAMRETLEERGITKSFPHGHELGLEVRDYPIIVSRNGLRIRDDCIDVSSDLPMEEGMINNLEVSLFWPVA